jgi:hypothetical protein
MKLKRYMEVNGLDDAAMSALVGDDCTPAAIKKYKYGERIPRPDRILIIQRVTGNRVTLRDWMAEAQ